MRRFRIGSAFGIPIQLDLTFLLILPIFAWIIGSQVTQTVDLLNRVDAGLDAAVLTTGSLPWVLGVAAAVGLFTGVILHELGHSLVARRYGYPIDSITLWLFGGIAQLTEMPEDWRQELTIAIAGPIVSVVLGVLSAVAFVAVPGSGETGFQAARFVLGYLALMNVALAGFNLLPGFPMDGGRVLRALLARNRPFARATRTRRRGRQVVRHPARPVRPDPTVQPAAHRAGILHLHRCRERVAPDGDARGLRGRHRPRRDDARRARHHRRP